MEENIPPVPEQPVITNSRFGLLKNKKYLLFFGATGLTLLIIVVWIIIVLSQSGNNTNTGNPSPTSTQQTSPSEPSDGTSGEPSLTPIPTTEAVTTDPGTETQVKTQIDDVVDVPYDMSKMKTFGDWAIIRIANDTTNPANVIIKKVNGKWSVVMGPGSHFDKADLRDLGAPEALVQQANQSF